VKINFYSQPKERYLLRTKCVFGYICFTVVNTHFTERFDFLSLRHICNIHCCFISTSVASHTSFPLQFVVCLMTSNVIIIIIQFPALVLFRHFEFLEQLFLCPKFRLSCLPQPFTSSHIHACAVHTRKHCDDGKSISSFTDLRVLSDHQ
jgi:hypothetical protein